VGRHSATDDVANDTIVSAAATATLPIVFTELAGPQTDADAPAAAPVEGRVGQPVDAAVSPTRADVNLLKAVPGLRARALAGVLVPFLLYTVLMVLLGRTDAFLIWLWIPAVLAGAVVGHLLDRAHEAPSAASGAR